MFSSGLIGLNKNTELETICNQSYFISSSGIGSFLSFSKPTRNAGFSIDW